MAEQVGLSVASATGNFATLTVQAGIDEEFSLPKLCSHSAGAETDLYNNFPARVFVLE
jgi:hypothetical protein